MKKMTTKLKEYTKNIGKRCIVTESSIAGLSNNECTIKDVSGDNINGYRYGYFFK